MKLNTGKLRRCIRILSEISDILVQVKEKPRVIDFIAIGTKAFDIAGRIKDELVEERFCDCYEFFRPPGKPKGEPYEWSVINENLHKYIIPHSKNQTEQLKTSGSIETSWTGEYHGFDVGWVVKGPGEVDALFVKRTEKENFYQKLCVEFWKNWDEPNLILNKDGFEQDEFETEGILETKFIRDISEYINGFIKNNEFSSCILHGKPGTGKTSAIQYIVKKLNLKSIRIPLKTFARGWNDPIFDFRTMLRITLPDILIIDDIDRLDWSVQKELLEFIDTSKHQIKFIIASANIVDNLMSPLKRPGRFDAHLEVPPLEREVIQKMLKDNNLKIGMEDWPISYIDYYKRYAKIFGKRKANKLIPELQARIDKSGEISTRFYDY